MSTTLSAHSLAAISNFFYQHSGIRLQPTKRQLVVSRLTREAARLKCATLDDYVARILAEPQSDEARHVVDILTTNETYFFRESEHFKHLAHLLRHDSGRQMLRVWSAAASSGEEAYSIAMTLARHAGARPWEVVGTDLSTRVVTQARQGLYVAERCSRIEQADLKRWCLRGEGTYRGQVLMNRELRAKVRFEVGNLLHPMPELGLFDVIFLRNVLIYFEGEAKSQLIANVIQRLKPGAYLYTGHAESLRGTPHAGLQQVAPSIYRATEGNSRPRYTTQG